jgi:SAM-dependent methyltransferase
MPDGRVEHGFTAVDRQPNPAGWIGVLDALHREPFYARYKARVIELLAPQRGRSYLEVGGGTGDDARAVAAKTGATVMMVDSSRTMVDEARRRGLPTATIGDATSLPFSDGSFDGCWADRTFQHLADPHKALGELVRVTRSAGRIVAVDPDYDTQVVDVADQALARRVLRWRADHCLRNGTIAHRMGGMFVAAGLSQVKVDAMTLLVRDHTAVQNVMGLRSWAASAHAAGILSADDAARWPVLIDKAIAAGRFLYAVTFFVTSGSKA